MIDITGLREDKRPQSSTIVHALLDRLEAAEKERDAAELMSLALRAKIEAMEKQEPIGWFARVDGDGPLMECKHSDISRVPLYTLPGAQPAPSVPTALLVAVADLVAQMEIVSRVGFVDTPNDKDSCAAFCVAEGTWLELMSCVESLAAALAAPEAKP